MSKTIINYNDKDSFDAFFMNEVVESPAATYVNYTESMLEAVASGLDVPAATSEKFLTLVCSVGDLLTLTKSALIGELSDQLISVKFLHHAPEQVYTPALFRKDSDEGVPNLILKIGNNTLLVTQDGEDFVIGDFKGKLRYSKEKTTDNKEITKVEMSLKNSTHTFIIPCILPEKTDYSQDDIEVHIESGNNFAELLRVVGSGLQYIKLRDLDEGVYPILNVTEPEGKMYGRFEIQLAEGNVTPNTQLNKNLEGFLSMCASFEEFQEFFKTQALRVISKEEKADGRVFVKAVFVKNTGAVPIVKTLAPAKTAQVTTKLKSAEVVSVTDDYPL